MTSKLNSIEDIGESSVKNIMMSESDHVIVPLLGSRKLPEGSQVIPTDHGDIVVIVVGDTKKPAIITYHDLGVDSSATFDSFFNFSQMRTILANFCVYHINAPGQCDGADPLPVDFVYPTLNELASQIDVVRVHYGITKFIGIGVGIGANVLLHYAVAREENKKSIDALLLINALVMRAGWVEWAQMKMCQMSLRPKGKPQVVYDYLSWYHFGNAIEERNQDLAREFRHCFEYTINNYNLSKIMDTHVYRSDLELEKHGRNLRIPILNIVGGLSPMVEDTVYLNSCLDPVISSWMKLSDCAMAHQERPDKVAEAFKLFLQGFNLIRAH